MTARILDGKAVAAAVLQSVASRVDELRKSGIAPQLVFVTLGSAPPAQVFARRLEKVAAPIGILLTRRQLPESIERDAFQDEIAALDADNAIDGVLVQMPLPPSIAGAELSVVLDSRKDVDGITVENAGRLYLGIPGQVPSTASAMLEILAWAGSAIAGRQAVIIGRSAVVGHPIAELLLHRHATVTVTHRQTRDLTALTRQADLLVVAAGRPRLVSGDMVKPDAVILDAGINVTPEGILGDVDFETCREVASAITPVPGGVGPVTNAVLLRNVVESAAQRRG